MIQAAVCECDYLAVVLSPAAVESAWVQTEWTTAFNRELEGRKVVVLPILYRDCDMPPFLKGKKYADFRRDEDYGTALTDLVRCLRGESKRPPR
ncbi:MAG: toll/interleukin-1 receptor domain-containing protein [Armatimonadetes bacterium]|nr:toll/interleukin-1 receptor domain-containing protein [Armatimonadota bacterium]